LRRIGEARFALRNSAPLGAAFSVFDVMAGAAFPKNLSRRGKILFAKSPLLAYCTTVVVQRSSSGSDEVA